MYKLVEKCSKFGIEIVRVFKSHKEAVKALAELGRKYLKKAGYYSRLGFQAVLSQGLNNFLSLDSQKLLTT